MHTDLVPHVLPNSGEKASGRAARCILSLGRKRCLDGAAGMRHATMRRPSQYNMQMAVRRIGSCPNYLAGPVDFVEVRAAIRKGENGRSARLIPRREFVEFLSLNSGYKDVPRFLHSGRFPPTRVDSRVDSRGEL
jgi:hypothetical protein